MCCPCIIDMHMSQSSQGCGVSRQFSNTIMNQNMCKIFSFISSRKPATRENWDKLMSFPSHFSFFVLVDKSYKKRKYYATVFFYHYFCLACLALQTENIVQKIKQACCKRGEGGRSEGAPRFLDFATCLSGNLFLFLVTSSTKTKNGKWDEKLKSVYFSIFEW